MDIFPNVENKVLKLIKIYKENNERRKTKKYESCKELVNIVNKIIENPEYKIDNRYKLQNIENPMYSFCPSCKDYNIECNELYNLVDNINKKHPYVRFNLPSPCFGSVAYMDVRYGDKCKFINDKNDSNKLIFEFS